MDDGLDEAFRVLSRETGGIYLLIYLPTYLVTNETIKFLFFVR